MTDFVTPSPGSSPVGYPTPIPTAKPTSRGPGAYVTLLGGGLLTIGSFLPWGVTTAPTYDTLNGLDKATDGDITIILGLLVIAIAVARFTTLVHPVVQAAATAIGVASAAIAGVDTEDILRFMSRNGWTGYIGIGLTAVFIGGLASVLGGIVQTGRPKEPLQQFTFREGMGHFLGFNEEQAVALAADMNVRMDDLFSPDFFVQFRNTKRDWDDGQA